MNVCGSVYQRGKSQGSKVSTVKKEKNKLKRQEKRSPLADKKEKVQRWGREQTRAEHR